MPTLRVFLVEDNPTIRQGLIDTLQDLAPVAVVGTAGTAALALEALDRDDPGCDLAIVDVFLADSSGISVLRHLQRQGRRLRRVVLTNYATPTVRASCLALGADRVFDKSTDVEALIDFCTQAATASPAMP